jgi:hypothetical protein
MPDTVPANCQVPCRLIRPSERPPSPMHIGASIARRMATKASRSASSLREGQIRTGNWAMERAGRPSHARGSR